MFFLLRTAFWLTLVLVLIPIGTGQESTSEEKVDPVSAFLAAQATMSDFSSFCVRNPEACETGGSALAAIGSRARDGARIVYEYLDEQVAGPSVDDALVTGSTATPPVLQTPQQTQGPFAAASPNSEQSNPTEFGPAPRPKPRSDAQS